MRRIGQGPEAALAVHCALAHGGAWRAVGERLSDLLAIATPDLPGHGDDAVWDGDDYLGEALHRVGSSLTEPMHVIGHSFGAVVAMYLALSRRSMIKSLVLIEPVLFAACEDFREQTQSERQTLDGLLAAGDLDALSRRFSSKWGGEVAWDDMPDRLRSRIRAQIRMIPAQSPALHDDSGGILGPRRLEALTMPVLLIEGSESAPVISCILDALDARLPDARRANIAGAGHMAPITHPESVATEIRAFLADIA